MIKTIAESIAKRLGIVGDNIEFEDPIFVPGRCASVKILNEVIGVLGQVNINIVEKFSSEIQKIFIFELSIEKLFDLIEKNKNYTLKKFSEFNRLPSSYRDLSLIVNSDIFVQDLIAQITKNKLVKNINIFDVFEGKGVPKNKKAIGLRLTYQSSNKTITSDEINKSEQKIIKELKNKFDIDIRE